MIKLNLSLNIRANYQMPEITKASLTLNRISNKKIIKYNKLHNSFKIKTALKNILKCKKKIHFHFNNRTNE